MKRWDGFMVDERCWEPRQPQDFVRGVADYQAPPFTRPEQSDSFIPVSLSSWFINAITNISNTTLTLVVHLSNNVLTLTILTSSTVSMVANKIAAYVTGPRQVNGSSINKTTLG